MTITRRAAILAMGSAVATLIFPLAAGVSRTAGVRGRLGVRDIVVLHLDQLGRCGSRGAECARRWRPALLDAARRAASPRDRPADVAFALIERCGEFPWFPGRCGGEL